MADRIRRDQDDLDLDDEQSLPNEGGLAELSDEELDEDDDFDLDDEND